MNLTIHPGDALTVLQTLPAESVHCVVTSPPYWGLRDYGVIGQLGVEKTPEEFVAKMVAVFREVYRVLRNDGTLYLNLGDSFCSTAPGTRGAPLSQQGLLKAVRDVTAKARIRERPLTPIGMKPKDLVGIPWMTAFALRADGWYLRQQIPWVKKNAMPESVTDRPASACETIFLLSKSERYYYDHEAVKLPASMAFINDSRHQTGSTLNNDKIGYDLNGAQNPKGPHRMFDKQRGHSRRHAGFNDRWDGMEKKDQCDGWRSTRNSDWFFEGLLTDMAGDPVALTVNPCPFKGAHFATFPENLVKPFILAGCPVGGVVMDPFFGSGTVGKVAVELGRKCIGIELNGEYCELARIRCRVTPGLLLA